MEKESSNVTIRTVERKGDIIIVEEVDKRCEEIISKLNAGVFTLSEAVTEANKQLKIEYSEPLANLVWDLGGEEQRMLEKQDKEKFLASLSEEERKRYIERGGCVIPCKVCDPDSRNAPCYDP